MKQLAIAAILVLTSCASGDSGGTAASSRPSPETVSRALTVEANMGVFSDLDADPKKPWTTGVECTSYDFEGVRVQVLDGSGTILGVATFPTAGTWTKNEIPPDAIGGEAAWRWDGTCTWSVAVDDLTESGVYVVELDGWESVTYDADELETDDWTVSFDL
jgi:hypothetical protein